MITKQKTIAFLLFFFSFTLLQSQELGEFKPKDNTFGLGKLKSKSKKIYISNFSVNYQLYNEKVKTKKGGGLFGNKGVRGDATAELIVGLGNLSENDFQNATNTIYKNFLNELKTKGFELISADVAGQTNAYKGWLKAENSKIEVSEMPGMITAYPEGYTFYFEEKTKLGRFFGDKFSALDKTPQNLSKELDDAIVVDVDLYVFFMKDIAAYQGNAANIKIKTQLSLVSNEAVSAKSNDKSLFFKKKVEYATGINSIQFVCGKYNIGSSAESVYTGTLKKDLTIENVIDEKVIQSYAKGAVDFVGTDTYFGRYYVADNKSSSKTTIIEVDAKKYIEGVIKAGTVFLNHHLNEFDKEFK